MTDRDVVALTIWGEARGESIEGKIAVACVIQNRLVDGRWGSTYPSVCQARKQFSCWNAGDPNRAKIQALEQALEGLQTVEPVLDECLWVAEGLIAHRIRPRVKQATHYYAISIQPPFWTKGGTFVETIGQHSFYQGVK